MLEFSPPSWAKNRHVQTIISPLTRKFLFQPKAETWEFSQKNGITLIGKYSPGMKNDQLVILYHGLAGSENAPYVMGMTHALLQVGFSVLRMRLRGGEVQAPWVPYLYHAGLIEDVETALQHCRDRGFTKISVAGFSLSANTILKWLGSGFKPIEKAFVVSPPVRLQTCVELIDHPKNRFYQRYFLKKLKRIVQSKVENFPELMASYIQPQTYSSLRNFDDTLTAPFYGFQNANHYYEASSSFSTLRKIENKVCIVHSLDDPFVDSEDILALKNEKPKNIELRLFERGGHVGFFEGLRKGYAADRFAVEYFGA